MPTATIDIKEMRKIIHDEVQKAVREMLEEFDFMTEEDFLDREEAMSQREKGEAIDWENYKKKRGIE